MPDLLSTITPRYIRRASNLSLMSSTDDRYRPDVWTWLQSWYVGRCDGEWEHEFGVSIGALDNQVGR